jgi:hypothetical protein
MGLYFGLTSAALLFAALCYAPLCWDGSWILFAVLDSRAPVVYPARLLSIPLHSLALNSAFIPDDLRLPRIVFSATYAAIPMVALVTSWLVVRNHARSLFVWAALGIGLGTLPGQFNFLSDEIMAIHLFWPLLLSVLTGLRKSHVPVIVLCGAAIFFTHPVAAPLFAFAAGLAFIFGWRSSHDRRRMWLWALVFVALAALRFVILFSLRTAYEATELTWAMQYRHFASGVAGLPLAFSAFVLIAATMVFLSSFTGRTNRKYCTPLVHSVEIASLVVGGSLLVIWARDPSLWMHALDFRSWALVTSLPFMVLAGLERLLPEADQQWVATHEWDRRTTTLQIVATVFALVLSVQSTTWVNVTDRLRENLALSPNTCVSASSMGWIFRTPLYHWSTPAYAVILQGRVPRVLVLHGASCADGRRSEAVRVTPSGFASRKQGWFDLARKDQDAEDSN